MAKGYALLALFIFLFTCAGCETTKGAASGMAADSKNTWQNVSEVVGGSDQWIKDNLW